MSVATGVGSLPGSDARDFTEAVRLVLGELPDLPHLPELPGRGAIATITGRALAVVAELGADLQPAGWRLLGGGAGAGVDQRRARSLLAQDLDTLEELTQGYAGELKVQVSGPWTLAATVERPRGDKVLADAGARRELAQALAEGVGVHLADVRRRVPGATALTVQVDEPALPAVLAARVPTASGFGRHRSVGPPEAAEALGWLTQAIAAGGAEPVVHCCAEVDAPLLRLLRQSGARGVSLDAALVRGPAYDALGEAAEAGDRLLLGVVPTAEPAPGEQAVTDGALRLLERIGADPGSDRVVLTPACGLAGATPQGARRAMSLARLAARNVTGG